MYHNCTRNIVGKDVIIEEWVDSERRTKNIFTQKIVRKTINCIVLECGHKISVLCFKKVPSNRTDCGECRTHDTMKILLDAGIKFELKRHNHLILQSNDGLISVCPADKYWWIRNDETKKTIKHGGDVFDLIKECKG